MMYAAQQIEGTCVGLVREREWQRIEVAPDADRVPDNAEFDGRRVSAEILMPRRGAVAPKGMKARGGLSKETARRLACDAAIVRIGHGKDGRILSVGRKTRRVPTHIRRALEARDRGCRFPACGLRHHVEHWADGGETDFRKLILLCDKHHTAVHEGQVRVCLNHEGEAVFFKPNGDVLRGSPPVRMTTAPAGDEHTTLTRHCRPLDDQARELLPWHKKGADRYSDAELPLEILNRAREAL